MVGFAVAFTTSFVRKGIFFFFYPPKIRVKHTVFIYYLFGEFEVGHTYGSIPLHHRIRHVAV